MLIVGIARPRLQITRRERRVEHQNDDTNAYRNNEDRIPFAFQLEKTSSGVTLDRKQGRRYLGVWNKISDDDRDNAAGY